MNLIIWIIGFMFQNNIDWKQTLKIKIFFVYLYRRNKKPVVIEKVTSKMD